jgi:hypothetical protein
MGKRANLQKSDGGRVPRPWRDGFAPWGTQITRSELASLTGRRKLRAPITPADLAYGKIRPNSDSTSEPTPPKGGSDDPLRGSFARTSLSNKFL